jgi:hypothetical protein
MIRQYYEEWPDDCSRQAYPFINGTERLDTTRELSIPNEYVLDARLWPDRNGGRPFLRAITRSGNGLLFEIHDLQGPLMQCRVDANDLRRQRLVFRHVANNEVTGWIKLAEGALANIYDHPNGEYRFTTQSTEFAATVVSVVDPGGLTAFQVGDERLTGDVLFFGGRGVDLEVVSGYLIVNLIGDPYARRDVCADPEYAGALLNPLRQIQARDLQTGRTFVINPVGGTFLSTAKKGEREVDGHKADAYHSPGPNGELLSRIV